MEFYIVDDERYLIVVGEKFPPRNGFYAYYHNIIDNSCGIIGGGKDYWAGEMEVERPIPSLKELKEALSDLELDQALTKTVDERVLEYRKFLISDC
ncbi:MAG: hypothetical protein AAGG02_17540 [Cyanobacteria bacterium P01_H01_bin.15]